MQSWDSEIPELVCSRIIKNCDQKTLQSLRQVSYHWNQCIEEIGALNVVFVEWSVENIDFLQRLFPKIFCINIKAVKTWMTTFEIVGYFLTELKVQCGITDDTVFYLQKLRHLTSLTLEGNSLFAFGLGHQDLGSHTQGPLILKNLKYLNLAGDVDILEEFTTINRTKLQSNMAESMIYLLKHIRTPCLVSLEIVDYVTADNRYHRDSNFLWEDELLTNFVAAHSCKLRKLTLICPGSHDTPSASGESGARTQHRLSPSAVPTLLTEVTIRFRENEGCFMNSSYNYYESHSNHSSYWIELLKNQFNLKKLDLCSFASISKQIFRSIIANNAESLEYINCCGLSLLELGSSELKIADSCMQNCLRLTKLKLGLGCLYTSYDSLLDKIPRSTEDLEITSSRIPIAKLDSILLLDKLKSLKLFGVTFINGKRFEFRTVVNKNERGTQLDALKKILRMRSLNSINISSFHNLTERQTDEIKKLETFCRTLDSKFGEEYEFENLYRILSVKLKLKVLIHIPNCLPDHFKRNV